jgi:hypothetical protein
MSEPSSPFLRSALELEKTFAGLGGLAQSLERLELEGESNLERAKKLLLQFTQQSAGLQSVLEAFSESLQARRQSVEQAVALVNAKAPQVADALSEVETRLGRFQELAERVRLLNGQAARLAPGELRQRLDELLEESGVVQEEARSSKLRTLELKARELRSGLKELRLKL